MQIFIVCKQSYQTIRFRFMPQRQVYGPQRMFYKYKIHHMWMGDIIWNELHSESVYQTRKVPET